MAEAQREGGGGKPPPIKNPDGQVTITLTRRQCHALISKVRHSIRRLERQNEKSTFVPEPGRVHVGKVLQRHNEELAALLEQAMASSEDT